MDIVISSGHGLHIRGASGPSPWGLDEVDEARKVVETVAEKLRALGVGVTTFHDDISDDQSENLERIVDFHNSRVRDLDVSVHFNCYDGSASGTEVLYVSQQTLAEDIAAVMTEAAGFVNRGAKHRSDLYFLNQTEAPSVLLEICFCDNESDAELYRTNFDVLCGAIANMAADELPVPEPPELPDAIAAFSGKCSWFGGPEDTGVSPSEGLAFLYDLDDAPELFLPQQPPGTTGLARRLNPAKFYIACRWDYDTHPKEMLADQRMLALVRSKTGKQFYAHPADWGPHEDTDRVADLSPGLLEALGLTTDDEVDVVYPAASMYRGA